MQRGVAAPPAEKLRCGMNSPFGSRFAAGGRRWLAVLAIISGVMMGAYLLFVWLITGRRRLWWREPHA